MTTFESVDRNHISRGHARLIFLLLFLLYMFDYIDRLVIVSLFPSLKQEWGLSDAQCGLLISAVYWSILAFSFPVSILVDRWSRKKSIGLMALLWSFATLACAFTKSFSQLFAARTAIGIGEAGYAPGGTAMISSLFSKKNRARTLGIWNASIPLGSALGIAIGGYVVEHFGWRHAFGLVALPGMIIALLFFFVRDYKTVGLVMAKDNGEERGMRKMGFVDIAGQFTRNPALLFNNLGFAASVFVTTSLLSWLPTYFHRAYGLDMTKAGLRSGSIMLMAIIGAPLAGYLTDRWMKSKGNARMLFPSITSVLGACLLFMAFSVFTGTAQYMALLLLGIVVVGFLPGAVAVTQDVIHPGLRAMSLGLNVVVQHLLGSALGPPFVGMMSDIYGLEKALLFLPAFSVLAAVLFFAGSLYFEQAKEKVETIEKGLGETS